MQAWKKRLPYYRERLLLVLLMGTPEVAMLKSGGGLVLFGGWLFLTGNLFSRYPKFFRSMSDIAPEWGWASFLVLTGLAQIAAVATGSRPLVRNTALAACAVHVFLTVMFWQGDWRAPTIAFLVAGALTNLWIYLRTSPWWQAGEADGEQ